MTIFSMPPWHPMKSSMDQGNWTPISLAHIPAHSRPPMNVYDKIWSSRGRNKSAALAHFYWVSYVFLWWFSSKMSKNIHISSKQISCIFWREMCMCELLSASEGLLFYRLMVTAWLLVGLAWFAGVISNIQSKFEETLDRRQVRFLWKTLVFYVFD